MSNFPRLDFNDEVVQCNVHILTWNLPWLTQSFRNTNKDLTEKEKTGATKIEIKVTIWKIDENQDLNSVDKH